MIAGLPVQTIEETSVGSYLKTAFELSILVAQKGDRERATQIAAVKGK